jgi:hypothetical protein
MEDFIDELNSVLPRLCKKCSECGGKFPASAWDKMPAGCTLEGWLFKKREEIKQKIRKQKELLLTLELNLKTSSQSEKEKITEEINSIKKLIEEFSAYGSENW